MKKIRADIYLVENGHVSSRTKAQDLIRSGAVSVSYGEQKKVITSPSEELIADKVSQVLIEKNPLDKFVSRAGLKLEGALDHLQLNVTGWTVLDVGISTGGFSDCLLQRGAMQVVGIDVGHDQLAAKLRQDPRVINLEGINAREIHKEPRVQAHIPGKGFPLIVIDVSFISLSLVLPAVSHLLGEEGCILALVKPQFEVGPDGLGKGGLVKENSLYQSVELKIRHSLTDLQFVVKDYFESSISGKDGNREFFIFAQKENHV